MDFCLGARMDGDEMLAADWGMSTKTRSILSPKFAAFGSSLLSQTCRDRLAEQVLGGLEREMPTLAGFKKKLPSVCLIQTGFLMSPEGHNRN